MKIASVQLSFALVCVQSFALGNSIKDIEAQEARYQILTAADIFEVLSQ